MFSPVLVQQTSTKQYDCHQSIINLFTNQNANCLSAFRIHLWKSYILVKQTYWLTHSISIFLVFVCVCVNTLSNHIFEYHTYGCFKIITEHWTSWLFCFIKITTIGEKKLLQWVDVYLDMFRPQRCIH